ncbi:MAG: peroxidase-related enzyme [Candidatus Thermoplasmatota archaeon]
MSWIHILEKNQSQGKLEEIYEKIEKKRGKLSNIMKVQSLNPKVMQKHLDLYLSIMFSSNSSLSREEKEMIGVVVSSINKCEYCINHHSEALYFYWKDYDRIDSLVNEDFSSLNLSKRKMNMIKYITKLTNSPNKIKKKDINLLKNNGFTDREILDVNLVASYFNFVNRIALGLGITFSKEEREGYKY